MKGMIKNLGKGILKVADDALLGGVFHNATEDTSAIGGAKTGTIDVNKLVRTILVSSIPVILLISILTGLIDVEEAKHLLKLF